MHSWLLFIIALPLDQDAAWRRAPPPRGSSFAGSTTTFAFPPPNVTATIPDPNFPVASDVGFAGPTPTGDEAEALATAPAFPKVDTAYPLIQPDTSDHKITSFNVFHSWGNLAPWFSVTSSDFGLPGASPLIPEGCGINQVFLLHRHGARYPTGGSDPASFASKLHAAAAQGFSASGPLAFLNDWTYKLGAETLTPFGREQLYELGVGFRVNYGDLLKGFSDLPVFRTTSEARMVDSALQFAAGFFGVQEFTEDYHQLIEIEQEGFNTTLQPGNVCPNTGGAVGGFGGTQSSIWSGIYTKPIIERLSRFITGFNLTTSDIIGMQQACAYETNALGFSSFCDLFTEEEWKQFEYFNDLGFWYGDGPGNPTAAARGIGWVQELVSRLTQTRITDFDTAVNETIVSSPTLFPLNQPIYVDATHDNVLSVIVTALNFTSLRANGPLPTDHIPEDQKEQEDSHVDPGELIKSLLDMKGRLEKVWVNKEASTEGRVKKVQEILGDVPALETPDATDAKEEPEEPPKVEEKKEGGKSVADMDRRVGELEKLVGSASASLDEPLLPLLSRLNTQLTVLTQPRHLDNISRRLKLLLSDLERVSSSNQQHRRSGHHAEGAPVVAAPSVLQEQMMPILTRLVPNLPHIPHILTRLRTLSALHTSAAEFQNTLEGLEEDQKKVREALDDLTKAVESVESSLQDNAQLVRGNVSGLEERIESLMRRLEQVHAS
ncbi:hypothetical protein EWM64_g4793 [Hericium alpestre]|uniref:Uncharacterized protein n=1 Tax=Hericium alpestre TaxID=135208 RepID=A0A4Z0A0A9_9AGAM|nr:hypothetical protein EWM64_g4793 [Hericium alpestre]